MLGCTLDELGARMSLDEFHLWLLFDQESPLADLRADIHSAQVTTAVMNMAGKSLKESVGLETQVLFRPREAKDDPKGPGSFFRKS